MNSFPPTDPATDDADPLLPAAAPSHETITIPVIEETAHIAVETVETGRIRVVKDVEEWLETLRTPLTEQSVVVERVPVDRVVAEAPAVRQEGDVTIISIVREEAVVVKRLVLVEEVRIRRTSTITEWQEQVPLRAEVVRVERAAADSDPDAKT